MVGEADAELHGGFLVGEQLFAGEVEAGVECERIGAGAEGDGRGEFAGAHDAAGDGLVGRIGDGDAAGGNGGERLAAEGDLGGGDGYSGFVEDAHGLSGGAALGVGDELAFADEGAGGNLAADEIDEPCAGAGEFGQGDGFAVPDDGGLGEGEAALVVGHEAVEIEADIRFAAVAREVGGEVEFVDADEEVRGVFEVEGECGVGVGSDEFRRAGGEGDGGFLLEFLELDGAEDGAPAVGVFTGEQAGFGVDAGEAAFGDEGCEVFG